MELQKFITDNLNYIELFKQNNFKIRKFKDLVLVKRNYNDNNIYENDNEYWKMYCRGAIINTTTNKLVCIPPVKAKEINKEEFVNYYDSEEIQELIDGTMINLFFYNNEWIISTRSSIGGYNKWNNKSFKQMFNDCQKINYDKLNKNYSYSFVMKHIENRNISNVKENILILVEVYDLNNFERLKIDNYPEDLEHINNILSYDIENMKDLNNFNVKGFTVKNNNMRYKIINPLFKNIENLKINLSGDLIQYIELRKNGNLKEYLNYYPEKNKLFNNYREKIHILSNELYNNYKDVFIYKKKDKKEIPYHLKPFVYEIHSSYLKTKKPTSWQDIKDYIHNLPSKRLVFSLNYMN